MATYPYFVMGPTAILSLIGLLHGPDKTIPTPPEDWHNAIVDVIIPTYNERQKITFCLASLAKQTIKPRRITLIDDASPDNTGHYAAEFSKQLGMDLQVIRRIQNEGKTPSLAYGAYESDSDIEFILDGDTILASENYIERLIEEIYKGVGIASACGYITPIGKKDFLNILSSTPNLKKFQEQFPETQYTFAASWIERFNEGSVAMYREMLYQFLQRYIYHAEMVLFGSIINPVGCAVAYRRKYLKEVMESHKADLGMNLTTSEDIFIGFNFISRGYRNIQVQDVVAKTKEPPLTRLHRQVFLWSSSFLQSCYYSLAVVNTPFKALRLWLKQHREKRDPEHQAILNRRKIQEPYRQAFGEKYTENYGRPMGWYIFTSTLEKIIFPFIFGLLIFYNKWEILIVTLFGELFLFSLVNAVVANHGQRWRSFGKSILVTPFRYGFLIFDIYIILLFFYQIGTGEVHKWRK